MTLLTHCMLGDKDQVGHLLWIPGSGFDRFLGLKAHGMGGV